MNKVKAILILLAAMHLNLCRVWAAPSGYLLAKVFLQGQTGFSSELMTQVAGWQKTQPYSDERVEQGIDQILKLFENSGYPYAQVLVENLQVNDKREVILSVRIAEGPLVQISRVEFEGVTSGLKKVLEEEIDFHPGEKFSAEKWQQRLRQLRNLPYVKDVKGPDLKPGLEFDQAVVGFAIEEKNNSLSGAFGYIPGQGSRAGYMTGNISLGISNFLGGARDVDIFWNKKDQSSFELDFGYTEYRLWRTPFSAGLEIHQSQTDSSFSKVGWQEKTSYRINSRLSVSSLLGWERVYQRDYLKEAFPSSRKLWLGLAFGWTSLDNSLNPRQGLDLQAQARIVNWQKTDTATILASPQKDRLMGTQVSLWNFLPVRDKQTLALKMAYAQIASSQGSLSPAELYKLGGIGSLRGYLTEQFWTDQALLTTLEYRLLLSEETRLYFFTDMAKFRQNFLLGNRLASKPAFRLGYGMGLWLASKVGLLGLDLGLGQSDQLADLKVHLRLNHRF